jgi:hypothetical protein
MLKNLSKVKGRDCPSPCDAPWLKAVTLAAVLLLAKGEHFPLFLAPSYVGECFLKEQLRGLIDKGF